MSNFHAESIASILNRFNTNMEQGLSQEALQQAKVLYGENAFESEERTSPFKMFLKHLLTWRILVLTLATAILTATFISNESRFTLHSAGVVAVVLVFHICWTYLSEYFIRRREDRIRDNLVFNLQVIRQGKFEKCTPADIVPGDLLSLSAGDYIPADARIIEADGLMLDESALFGTEGPVPKTSEDIPDRSVPPQNQKNMAFGGTYVEAGHGLAIVVQTGKQLEMRKQRRAVHPVLSEETSAEKEITSLYNIVKGTGLVLAAIAVAIAWWFEYQDNLTDWHALVHLGVLFVVASAPQNAAALLRLSFSQHAQKLLEKGVVLRNSHSIEKLSRINTFCANENGLSTTRTLTISNLFVDEQLVDGTAWKEWLRDLKALTPEERKESVNAIPPGGQIPQGAAKLIYTAGLGTSGEQYQNRNEAVFTPQRLIQEDMEKLGYQLDELRAKLPLVNEYPWTLNFGYQMQVFELAPDNYINIIFGDAQTVLDACTFTYTNNQVTPLQEERYKMYCEVIDYLLSTKAKVYGVAYYASDVILKPQEMEDDQIFLGFISFSLNNNEKIKAVVKKSLDSGLKIVLLTESDEQRTIDFAKDLGLIHTQKAVASRAKLDALTRENFDAKTAKCSVYSQPTWVQRRNIVLSLRRQGHSVGFLGEGVADLRAMAVANIALANIDYASHVVQAAAQGLIHKLGFRAVKDGLLHARETYHNAASFLRWNLSCTLSLLLTLGFGTVLHYVYKLPMPLTLTQVVWVQFLVTLLPSLGAGADRIFADEKHHRPTMFSTSRFLSKTSELDIICRAVTISLMSLIPFFFILWHSSVLPTTVGVSELLRDVISTANLAAANSTSSAASDIAVARTATCTTLIFTQLAACWQALRYPWESLFRRMFANYRLLVIFSIVIGLHLIVLYIEPIRAFLGMAHLKWEWRWTLLFSFALFLLPLNLAINSRSDAD